ncbi:MAG: hypothetical protein IIA00_03545 [Proteobacteria bacterium]|nr:hypothetical protein [Pseudomonadota bacterium]
MADENETVSRAELDHRLQQERDDSHAKWEGEMAQWKHERQFEIEMFRSVMPFASMSLRAPLLINGGAATVLLAFIGHIVTTEGMDSAAITGVIPAMRAFLAGLFSGALAVGSAYASQLSYKHERLKVGVPFHILTVVLFLVSIVAFLWGAWSATTVFLSAGP